MVGLEACWGLFSLPEFEGLTCVHHAMTLVRFDLPASHLENTLSADESCQSLAHAYLTGHNFYIRDFGLSSGVHC